MTLWMESFETFVFCTTNLTEIWKQYHDNGIITSYTAAATAANVAAQAAASSSSSSSKNKNYFINESFNPYLSASKPLANNINELYMAIMPSIKNIYLDKCIKPIQNILKEESQLDSIIKQTKEKELLYINLLNKMNSSSSSTSPSTSASTSSFPSPTSNNLSNTSNLVSGNSMINNPPLSTTTSINSSSSSSSSSTTTTSTSNIKNTTKLIQLKESYEYNKNYLLNKYSDILENNKNLLISKEFTTFLACLFSFSSSLYSSTSSILPLIPSTSSSLIEIDIIATNMLYELKGTKIDKKYNETNGNINIIKTIKTKNKSNQNNLFKKIKKNIKNVVNSVSDVMNNLTTNDTNSNNTSTPNTNTNDKLGRFSDTSSPSFSTTSSLSPQSNSSNSPFLTSNTTTTINNNDINNSSNFSSSLKTSSTSILNNSNRFLNADSDDEDLSDSDEE